MEFRLQVLLVQLVTLYMGVDGLLGILEDLFFIDVEQVECDIVRVCLNCVGEELNLETHFGLLDKLKGESESPGKNEDLNDLVLFHKFLVELQEFQDVVM